MMGIGPADAGRLTYWQYTALRHEWNVRHRLPDAADDDIELPTADFVRERQAELDRLGISGKVH
jgi:hypothetical protein